MKEKKSTSHEVIRRGFLFCLVILLHPTGTAMASPDDCLAYGYTESGNHYFLLMDNASMFGDNMTIITNCEYIQIELDGEFYANISKSTKLTISPGIHNLSFINDNFTSNYQNVVFYPDYLQWEFNYSSAYQFERPEFIDAGLVDVRINWAVFFGIVMVWVLAVYVYWNLINTFVQRNFIEEVTQ